MYLLDAWKVGAIILHGMSKTVRQSGVIPYRRREHGIEVLLITSSGTGRWQFPKGMLEPGLSPRESAEQEAFEEAGATGIAHDEPISSYTYWKQGVLRCKVTLFAMPVQHLLSKKEWEESHFRKRRWATIDEAAQMIHNPDIRQCLAAFQAWCVVSL